MTSSAGFKIQPKVLLSEAIGSPALLGGPFQAASFWTWRTLAKVIDGIELREPREIELFEQCTGRSYSRHNRRAVRRLILLCGRRGGKDRFFSAVAVWRAALCQDWKRHISAGEGAVVLLLGADKKQAGILRRYCHGLLRTPLLEREILRETNEVIEFKNGGSLEVITNDERLIRGRSAIGVFGSEACHWKTNEDNSSSDEEVVAAAEPSMAMCPDLEGGILALGSSVFRKKGYMYRRFRELHGDDSADDLVWFAPSAVMNPALPRGVIDRALAENPSKARAEYLNEWREDISDFIPTEIIEACTDTEVFERQPQPGVHYVAFCDAAGGLGKDSFTLGIAHREPDDAGTVVLDVLRERKPRFVPRDVVAEFAALLKSYNIYEVMGDKFAGGFHSDEWLRNGITFKPCEHSTSENYLFWLPMLLARRGRLLDNTTLRAQVGALEQYIPPSGHTIIRHPQIASAHDDCATAAAGAMVRADDRLAFNSFTSWVSGPDDPGEEAARWQQQRLWSYVNSFSSPAGTYNRPRMLTWR